MKASDVIKELQSIIVEHGDIDIVARTYEFSYDDGREIELKIQRIQVLADSTGVRASLDTDELM